MFPDSEKHIGSAVTRRDVLVRAAHGFGSIALASLLDLPVRAAVQRVNPMAAKPPNFPAKAKSVIFLYMEWLRTSFGKILRSEPRPAEAHAGPQVASQPGE